MAKVKDITKLKIWKTLECEGFKLKDYKTGNVTFGRGAILCPDEKRGFPFMEIQPLLTGQWHFKVDYFDKSTEWCTNPHNIQKMLGKELEEFKKFLNQIQS